MLRPSRPTSPTSPKHRHSLFRSPDHADNATPNKQEAYHFNLTAAIEDAILTMLPDELTLTQFSSFTSNSYGDPYYQFRCVIKRGDEVILDENYSLLKLISIENLAAKISSDCNKIHVDAEKLAACIYRGIDQNNVLLAPLDPGVGKAVFISGEDPALGHWEIATRLHYNKTQKAWRITLPERINKGAFKYLINDYALGKSTSTKLLGWENGDNRTLKPEQCGQATPANCRK